MNRSQRRQHRRGALADLRRAGCTCTPQMDPIPAIVTPFGSTGDGYHVTHTAGCPFGDTFVGRNADGITPFVVVSGASWGCQR